MSKICLSILLFLIPYLILSQEFIPTDVEIATTSVSTCLACDGACVVSINETGMMTYRWDDSIGNLVAIETTDSGTSSAENLCLGSYKLTISSGLEVVNEFFFSITEIGVELGVPGQLYSCSNYESLNLNDYLPEGAQSGGQWANQLGGIVETVPSEILASGLYTYSVNNAGCLNISEVPVIINQPANVGEFPNVQICEDFEPFDFWVYADSDNYPDPNGVFLNENYEEVVPLFNPQDSLPGEYNFLYVIDTVPGCTAPVDPFFIRVNSFNEAGSDASVYACSIENEELLLDNYLSEEANDNGLWYDVENNLIESTVLGSDMNNGPFRYTVTSNVPCLPDVSYVNVIFVEELDELEDMSFVMCSDSEPFELDDFLDADFQGAGSWFDSQGAMVEGMLNPSEGISDEFTYALSGIGCELIESVINIETEILNTAGEDNSATICISEEPVDLSQFLSEETSDQGVWLNENLEPISNSISATAGAHTYSYFIEHTVCPDQETNIELIVDESIEYPSFAEIHLCSGTESISLSEELSLNVDWGQVWLDQEGNEVSSFFMPMSLGSTLYSLSLDPQNACETVSTDVSIIVEENQFNNQTIATQICETAAEVELQELLPAQILSSNFIITDDFDNEVVNSTTTLSEGINVFQIIETGIEACSPSVVNLELELVPFNDAGNDQSLALCSNSSDLDLLSLTNVLGEWSFEGEVLTEQVLLLNESTEGIYEFIATNSSVCPESSMILDLEVELMFDYQPLPNSEYCFADEVVLQSPLTGVTTSWSVGEETIVGNNLILNELNPGVENISYTMSTELCVASESLAITILPEFNIDISGETSLCDGEELLLEISDGISGQWELNEVLVEENENSIAAVALDGAHYVVLAENSAGCLAMDSVTIQVNPLPSVEIQASQFSGCAPFSLELQAISLTNSENSYQWLVGNDYYNASEVSVEVQEGDQLDVLLYAQNSFGCVTSIPLNQPIQGFVSPMAQFNIDESSLSYLEPKAEFTNESLNYSTLNWSIDGEQVNGGSESWSYEFSDEPFSTYEICLIAESLEGCLDEFCQIINVNSELLLYIPNAFTPDGDGLNEVFKPQYSGNSTEFYQFQVFDRWGHEMFFTENVDDFWNGNVKNGDHYAPPGVYTYVVSIKDAFTAEIQSYKGHVTLIR